MRRIIRITVAVLVLAAVLGSGYWYYENHVVSTAAASGTTYTRVVSVTQGSLNGTVSVVGQLEAEQSASLKFDLMNGTTRLASLNVQAGNTVAEGQVLASIDPTPYQQALDQAQSDLAAAEEALADLQTPATALRKAQADVAVAKAKVQLQKAQAALDDLVNPDIAKLQAAVVSARTALAKAQADLQAQQQSQSAQDQLARLVTAEATPTATYTRLANETYWDEYYQDRLELAYNKMMDAQDARVSYALNQQATALQLQAAVRKARANLAAAEEALADARGGGDALAVAQAQLAVSEGEVNLQAALAARAELDEGPAATKLAAAQAAVDKKRLAVQEAEAALAGTQMRAPFDGTVLEVNVSAGSQVTANTAVLTVADLGTLRVVAAVDETTVRQVRAGQVATISFDAYRGQSFTDEVLAVPLQGTLQGGVMVYSVPVSLTGAEGLSLLVGMTANVEIAVAQATDVLLVPTVALRQTNGKYQGLVPNRADPTGDPVAVAVEVGLSDGTYTQITKGLNAGDQVLVQLQASSSGSSTRNMGGNNVLMSVSRQLGR